MSNQNISRCHKLSLIICTILIILINFIQADDVKVASSDLDKILTVRINTFRRNDLLKQSLTHYLSCNIINEIQVVWSDLKNQPPTFHDLNDHNKIIKYEIHDKDSLNNRFIPTLAMKTEVHTQSHNRCCLQYYLIYIYNMSLKTYRYFFLLMMMS